MTARVYRLEHIETGKGPFTSCNVPNAVMNDMCRVMQCQNDAKAELSIQYHEICGTDKARDLAAWFGFTFKRLLELGYQILRYEVPAELVRIGQMQVVFDKTVATGKSVLTYEQWRHLSRHEDDEELG